MNRLGAFEGLKQTVAHFGLSVHDRGCPFSGRPCYLLVFFDELDHGLLLLLYATISKYGIHYDHLWLIIVSLTVTFISLPFGGSRHLCFSYCPGASTFNNCC